MDLNSIDNNLEKASFSFKIFNFLCAPAMFYLMLMSYLTGHTAGVYLIDKKSIKENNDG